MLFPTASANVPTGSLRLTAYPEAVVADGRSLITVNAEVRTREGRLVPDGTQVALTTTLGTFRESMVATQSGVARAVLVAGQVPGIAQITATALGYATVGELQILFARDQSELASLTDYVEITASEYLAYSVDLHLIAASGAKRGAVVRYHFSTVEADDLQLDCYSLTVRARNARLRYGGEQSEYEELVYSLRSGDGQGITQREGQWLLLQIRRGHTEPAERPLPPEAYRFKDLSGSQMTITARGIWLYPGDKVQFRRAEFWVGATKAFSLPLYSHSLTTGSGTGSALFGVRDGRLYLDLPYYYALTPTTTGAFRLRTQQRAGRGLSAAQGWFLDLEHQYRRRDRSYGTFTLGGLTRNDWGIHWHHFQPVGGNTQLYFWLDSPAHSSLFGSVQIGRQWKGLYGGLNLSASRAWRGGKASSHRSELYLSTTPQSLGPTPLNYSLALNANLSVSATPNADTLRRQGIGLRWRLYLNPISLDSSTTFTGGLTLGRYVGNLGNQGWEMLGTLSLTKAVRSFGSLTLTYDYTQDPLSANLLGRHRLSGTLLGGDSQRLYLSLSLSRALDQRFTSLLSDLSYRLSPQWRIGFGLTWQEYSGFRYRDQTYTLAYRLGYHELALSWSKATRRWSFEVLTVAY